MRLERNAHVDLLESRRLRGPAPQAPCGAALPSPLRSDIPPSARPPGRPLRRGSRRVRQKQPGVRVRRDRLLVQACDVDQRQKPLLPARPRRGHPGDRRACRRRAPRARGHRRRPSARLRARLRALGPDRRSARGRLRGPRVLRALPRRIRRAAARPHQARRDGPAAGRRRGGWRRRRRARGRAARRGPAEGIRPHDARLPEGDRAGGASRRGDARDDGDARAARGVARRGGRVRCLRRGGAGPFGARLPVSGDR